MGRETNTPPQSGAGFHPDNFSSTSTYSNRNLQMPLYLPNSKPTALVRPERQPSYLEARLAFKEYGCSASGEGLLPIPARLLINDADRADVQAIFNAPCARFSIHSPAFASIHPRSVMRVTSLALFALVLQRDEGKTGGKENAWRCASNQSNFRRVSCPTSQNRTGPLGEQSSRLTNFTKTITQGQARMPYSHNPRMENRMN